MKGIQEQGALRVRQLAQGGVEPVQQRVHPAVLHSVLLGGPSALDDAVQGPEIGQGRDQLLPRPCPRQVIRASLSLLAIAASWKEGAFEGSVDQAEFVEENSSA